MKAVILALTFLAAAPIVAQRVGDPSYDTATYERSHSAAEVVLQVRVAAPQLPTIQSATVYGDGRVELDRTRISTARSEATMTLELGPEGADRLVDIAVRSGLAEWDRETINAWKRKRSEVMTTYSDGATVGISLNLESYERGPIKRSPLSIVARPVAPQFQAEAYPEIRQYRGAYELLKFFHPHWKALRTEEDDR